MQDMGVHLSDLILLAFQLLMTVLWTITSLKISIWFFEKKRYLIPSFISKNFYSIFKILVFISLIEKIFFSYFYYTEREETLTYWNSVPSYTVLRMSKVWTPILDAPTEAEKAAANISWDFESDFLDSQKRLNEKIEKIKANKKDINIVFLMFESLRYDMNDPEIMPKGLLNLHQEIDIIVSNIIFNAARYTNNAGFIKIKWTTSDAGNHFQVSDNGIGITQENIPRITERFFRVNNAQNGRSESGKFSNTGFALIYNDDLKKIKKLETRSLNIYHKSLKKRSLVKISNPINKKYLIAEVKSNKIKFSNFYNSILSSRIAEELELDETEPFVEITLISKNSTFVAKKSKMFDEEKKVAEKAPVDGIKIDNLGNSNLQKKETSIDKIFKYSIKIADFYYKKSALQMLDRIRNETSLKNFNIISLSKTKFRVILGPFNDINSLKNSYNKTTVLNFDNLEVIRND